jgi:hypothetical protein
VQFAAEDQERLTVDDELGGGSLPLKMWDLRLGVQRGYCHAE